MGRATHEGGAVGGLRGMVYFGHGGGRRGAEDPNRPHAAIVIRVVLSRASATTA